jgi:hypothetical protein
VDWLEVHHVSLNPQPPHLFPKQPSQIEPSSTAMSEPEQTDKHDQKKGDIGNRHSSDRQFIALNIG